MKRFVKVSLFVLLFLSVAAPAVAVDYFWIGGTGNYGTATNWNPELTATSEDFMHVNNGGTCQITANPINSISYLYAGRYATDGVASVGTIQQSGGDISLLGLRVGFTGATGTYDMSGGSLTGTGNLLVGYNVSEGVGPRGTMTMSNDARVAFAGVSYVGYGVTADAAGEGTLTMLGDTVAAFADLRIGHSAASAPGSDNLHVTKGTVELRGNAKLTTSGLLFIAVWNNSEGILNLYDNSSVTVSGLLRVGDANYAVVDPPPFTQKGTGYLTVNDNATLTASGAMEIGSFNSGLGTVTVGSGTGAATLNVGGTLTIGSSGGDGTLNIGGGGVVNASSLVVGSGNGAAVLNFNGGTVRARSNSLNFIADGGTTGQSVFVQSGGAIIDSNGFDIVVKTALQKDLVSTGGGLTKNSAGQLVLASGYNTYTGVTAVNAGTLVAYTDGGNMVDFGSINVAAGAKLMPAAWDMMNNVISSDFAVALKTSALTMADNSAATFVIAQDGLNSIQISGPLTAAGGSATVVTDFVGNVPWAGAHQIVGYGGKAGAVTFLPKVDGIGTTGVTIVDDGMSSISAVFADMNQWKTDGPSDNYGTGGNWTGSVAPNGANQRALFAGTGETVTLAMNATLSSLNFDGDGYNIIASGANKFTMDSSIALNAHIQNLNGSNTVAAPLVLNKDTQITVAQAGDTLTLSGALSGTGRIEKVGDGTLAMASLGSGPAGDLVLGGGTFRYIGATASTSRGLTTTGATTIDVADSDAKLTFNGPFRLSTALLYKTGAGTLELVSSGTDQAISPFRIAGGDLILSAGAGGAFTSTGMVVVGYGLDANGKMVLGGGDSENAGATLTTSSRIYIGDTNGKGVVEMSGYSNLASTGNSLYLGRGSASVTGTLNMHDHANLSIAASTSYIGAVSGTGTMTMEDDSTATINGDSLLIGDAAGNGSLTLSGNASLTSTTTTTIRIGQGANSVGTLTMSGQSTMISNNTNNDKWVGQFWVGRNAGGAGTVTLSGGTGYTEETRGAKLVVNHMSDIGSYGPSGETPAGQGYLNVHEYAQFETRGLVMGDGGNGYLLIDGHGQVTVTGNQGTRLGFFSTGSFSGELKDQASLNATGEVILGDLGGTGTMTLAGDSVLAATKVTLGITGDTYGDATGTLYFDGGTLKANASNTNFLAGGGGAAGTANAIIRSGGAKIDANGFDIVVNVDMIEDAGSTGGGLTKLGKGALTLGGANDYTGDTRVEGGTLTTIAALLNDTADVWIAAGAKLNLDFLGADTIDSLFLNNIGKAIGSWGSSASPADNVNDDYFMGTGMLMVTSYVPSAAIPGDADGNNRVDDEDAKRLAENWGATTLNPLYTSMWQMGDFNGDGKVDAKDASIMAANWGYGVTSESNPAAVPEPGMFALLLGLALAGLARRIRR